MMYRILILLALAALVLSACQAANPTFELYSSADKADGGYTSSQPASEPPAAAPSEQEASSRNISTGSLEVKRIVIKNAEISLIVDDPVSSLDRLSQMAERMGGYVVSANVYQQRIAGGNEVPQASLTIRVPAESLNDALAQIEAETSRPLMNKNINSQDVTSTYVDLQSRLRNLEVAEAQLQEIMSSAKKTEEVLSVYSQLTNVRSEIEVIKGQIQYYDQASSLSSISIQLVANEAVQPVTIAGWEPTGVAKSALQSLVNSLQTLATGLIWLGIKFLPLAVIILLPPFVLIKALLTMRRRTRRAAGPSAG
jgi:hypothetical protein